MTAPGDPLITGPGNSRYQAALAQYAGFAELSNQVEAAMGNMIPSGTKLLWISKTKNHIARGYVATIESQHGVTKKTAVFEVHFVAVNDKRNPTHLTFGTFDEKAKAHFIGTFGGVRVKGGSS